MPGEAIANHGRKRPVVERRRIPVIALVAALAIGIGGCRDQANDGDSTIPAGSDSVAEPFPAEGGDGSASSTGATADAGKISGDPFVVPAKTDAAYVNRVLRGLNKVYGDVVREVRRTGSVGPSQLESLRAIFNDPLFARQEKLFESVADEDPARLQEPMGDRKMTVRRLITAGPRCIFALVAFDFSAVLKNAPETEPSYVTLEPTQDSADPRNINPTPWSMSRESETRGNGCARR